MNMRNVARGLRWAWVLCSAAVFFSTLVVYDGTPATRDAELILVYGMMLLSFPAGQLFAIIVAASAYVAESMGYKPILPGRYLGICFEWIAFFAIGYVQWFVFLPRLIRRWRSWRFKRRELKEKGNKSG